jgi:hypothetical protein
VLGTQLHFDRVGWNARVVAGGRTPTLPNARYPFAHVELEDLEGDDQDLPQVPNLAATGIPECCLRRELVQEGIDTRSGV